MAQTRGSLSFNKWLLLLIPVSIAFFVGSSVPTLFGNDLNIIGGFIWGGVIGIIDYTLIRIYVTPKLAILRGIIVLFSICITALVGDLYFFKADIEQFIKEERKEQYAEDNKIYLNEHARLSEEIRKEAEGINRTGKGCGPKCEQLYADRDNLKKPTLEDTKVGPLFRLKSLHELIQGNMLANISFWAFSCLVLILEILPLLLKNATLK